MSDPPLFRNADRFKSRATLAEVRRNFTQLLAARAENTIVATVHHTRRANPRDRHCLYGPSANYLEKAGGDRFRVIRLCD
jgi:hypothetical protein